MTMTMTNLNIIFFLFILGFLINSFILRLVATGFIGLTLKDKLLQKINTNDYTWLNKILVYFFCTYFIYIFVFSNNIYLDSSTIVNVNLDGVNVTVKGDYIDKLFTNIGATSAFVIGSRLAASFLSKHPMSLGGKIGTTISAGAGSSVAFQMVNQTSGLIKGIITPEKVGNDSVSLLIKDVNISSSLNNENVDSLVELINMNKDIKSKLTPNIHESNLERFEKLTGENSVSVQLDNNNSQILEMVKEKHNGSLKEIFGSDTSIINSPLESNELLISNLKNSIIEILNYNLTINFIMIYFIIMLIVIFTIKFVINKNTFLDSILKLPLGKYFHYILSKLITAWQASSIIWIYFILFFLLIFSCSSTYAIYGCLLVLK